MNKIFGYVLFCSILSIFMFGVNEYTGSTTSAVTIVGGIIKTQHIDFVKKYKRSECPVCEGNGWYISGDKITKVPCGYCEPDKQQQQQQQQQQQRPKTIIHRR